MLPNFATPALLRAGVRDEGARTTLDVFDDQLVHAASELVRGRLERSPEGVLNLVADRLQRLALTVAVKSRDFR